MLLAILGGAVGIPLVLALSYLWRGYVLTILWAWFAMPIFHLPKLSLVPAIGACLVISFLTYQYIDSEKSDQSFSQKMGVAIGHAALSPAIYLGIGWVVQLAMPR